MRPRPEALGGGDQDCVPLDRFAEGGFVGDVLAGGGPGAQLGVALQHLAPAGGDGGDVVAVAELESVLAVLADVAIDFGGGTGRRVEVRAVRTRRAALAQTVVVRGLLGRGPPPRFRQVLDDLVVGDDLVGLVPVGPPVRDFVGGRVPVDVDVEALAVPGGGRVHGFARRPGVGEQEGGVDGEPLGGGDGQRVSVIEPDVAVVVADLVVVERDGPAVLGVAVDAQARLFVGAALPELELVDDDDGAVEQLLLPVRGADA